MGLRTASGSMSRSCISMEKPSSLASSRIFSAASMPSRSENVSSSNSPSLYVRSSDSVKVRPSSQMPEITMLTDTDMSPTMAETLSPLHRMSLRVVRMGREAPIVTSDMYMWWVARTCEKTALYRSRPEDRARLLAVTTCARADSHDGCSSATPWEVVTSTMMVCGVGPAFTCARNTSRFVSSLSSPQSDMAICRFSMERCESDLRGASLRGTDSGLKKLSMSIRDEDRSSPSNILRELVTPLILIFTPRRFSSSSRFSSRPCSSALPTLPVPTMPIESSREDSQKDECTALRARVESAV
mmetsp:Transcript_16448/g.36397  ORF Transcript_16448/g.36397 Transcript_16448/m.36397 type:complete len:300 (+) Transcript_16448:518-1417(+)